MVLFDGQALRCRGVGMGRRRHLLYGTVAGRKMLDEAVTCSGDEKHTNVALARAEVETRSVK